MAVTIVDADGFVLKLKENRRNFIELRMRISNYKVIILKITLKSYIEKQGQQRIRNLGEKVCSFFLML